MENLEVWDLYNKFEKIRKSEKHNSDRRKFYALWFLDSHYEEMMDCLKNFETKYSNEIKNLSEKADSNFYSDDKFNKLTAFAYLISDMRSHLSDFNDKKDNYTGLKIRKFTVDEKSENYFGKHSGKEILSVLREDVSDSLKCFESLNFEKIKVPTLQGIKSSMEEELAQQKQIKEELESLFSGNLEENKRTLKASSSQEFIMGAVGARIKNGEIELSYVEELAAKFGIKKQNDKIGNNLSSLFNKGSEFGQNQSNKQMK